MGKSEITEFLRKQPPPSLAFSVIHSYVITLSQNQPKISIMPSSKIAAPLLIVFFLIFGNAISSAQDKDEAFEGITIHSFSGESIPGVMTQVELKWDYQNPNAIDSFNKIKLFRINPAGDSTLVVELPGTAKSYVAPGDPGVLAMQFLLAVYEGDGMLLPSATAKTTAPVAHQGLIGAVQGTDVPNDAGGAINLEWGTGDKQAHFDEYKIYRNSSGQGNWELVGSVPGAMTTYTDASGKSGMPYNYMVRGYRHGEIFESKPVTNLVSHASWFNMAKINLLVIAIVVLAAIIWYVARSGDGKMHYIRKIAGLQAVEEAVGRATEMGKSVLYVPGIQDLDDVQTIAGLTILGSVAKMTAQYETRLDVPVSRSLVMSNGREVVKQAYMSVGRPDFYNDDIVHYVTDEQFGYVAAIDGIMVREQPAACFYMGAFFAESLILAETGNHVGAIQIAGTAMPTQLPFFVAACDYTLIGEELFAASAYLSKDAAAVASLKGQDVGKALAMGSIALGVILTTVASVSGGTGMFAKLSDAWLRLFALNF